MIFLGTPDFAGDLLQDILDKDLANVVGVWTKPSLPQGRGQKINESKIVHICKEKNIPLFQPEKIHDTPSLEAVKNLKADLAFIVAYGQIIRPEFYDAPHHGSYNLHFSLLPKYRGASPIQSALLAGEGKTGITIQKINKKMDEGDIAVQASFTLADMNQTEVFQKSTGEAKTLIQGFLQSFPKNLDKLKPQDHSQATYCGKLNKNSGKITPQTSAVEAMRKLRAFYPWPGTFFYMENVKFEILSIKEISSISMGEDPGTLISDGKKKLHLVLKDGTVEIDQIKRQGKKAMDTVAFLNGAKIAFPAKIDS